MKMKQFLILLALSTAFNIYGQKEITSTSKIKDVTVFLSGAEVHRKTKVSLNSGSNIITFNELSPFIVSNSIQIKAKNASVTIVSVNNEMDYLNDDFNSGRLKEITDSIEKQTFKKEIRLGHQRVYQEEKSLLLANKNIRGENNGVDVEDLMDMADLYRERLLDLETKLLDIKMQLSKINTTLNKLYNQKSLLQKGKTKSTQNIVVNVSSKSKITTEFELTYVITQASWIPKYDIRSNDISKPIALTYKADVYNLSGYDWENVNITLSTGNPSIDNTQPTLTSWYLQYYEKFKKERKRNYQSGKVARYAPSAPAYDSDLDLEEVSSYTENKDKELSGSLAQYTQIVESNVNTQFKINFPYTINSDGKPYLVEIQEHDLPVEYSYLAIPKKDGDAFLLARMTGWGSYNLLPGDANVYFEGTFVGNSYMETASTKDTLDISMGRDKSIVVKREKVKEFCKNSTFGSNKKSTRAYEISIRNNKSQAIEITILDQIPLSNKKEVSVEILEQNGAQYNEQTGELKWVLKIDAGASKKINFKFQVKYPKDYNLSNL